MASNVSPLTKPSRQAKFCPKDTAPKSNSLITGERKRKPPFQKAGTIRFQSSLPFHKLSFACDGDHLAPPASVPRFSTHLDSALPVLVPVPQRDRNGFDQLAEVSMGDDRLKSIRAR